MIDTATDNSNIEQFTFVVKYIHEGIKKYDFLNFHRNKHRYFIFKINHILLCLKTATDTSGKGMFEYLILFVVLRKTIKLIGNKIFVRNRMIELLQMEV